MDKVAARKVLGVTGDSSEDEIKRAYRKLSMVHHPDMGGDSGKFVRVKEAYDVLTGKVISKGTASRFKVKEPVRFVHKSLFTFGYIKEQ